MGTLLATVALADLPAPASDRQAKRAVNRVIGVVSVPSREHARGVSARSYIHPDVISSFSAGTLGERWEAAAARGNRLLVAEERKLLHLLRPRRGKRAQQADAA